jgi:hypothetical protein
VAVWLTRSCQARPDAGSAAIIDWTRATVTGRWSRITVHAIARCSQQLGPVGQVVVPWMLSITHLLVGRAFQLA